MSQLHTSSIIHWLPKALISIEEGNTLSFPLPQDSLVAVQELRGKHEGAIFPQPLECLRLTCPPENGVIEEGELHLCVVLQGSPAPRRRHVDVGHVQRDMDCQEGLGRVPYLAIKPQRGGYAPSSEVRDDSEHSLCVGTSDTLAGYHGISLGPWDNGALGTISPQTPPASKAVN